MWQPLALELALVVTAVVAFGIVVWWMSLSPPPPDVLVRWREDDPKDQVDTQAIRPTEPLQRHPQPSGALALLSILLVEDDDDSRRMLADTLEYYGARVVAVSSAAEALRVLHTHHADVLLSDLRLPEQDGLSLIHTLRSERDPVLARLPAASITASRRIEDRHHALAAGYYLHMQKPVDPDDLVSAVLTLATRPRDGGETAH